MYTDVGDGPVAEAEYHDWYDHEHGPARLRVPGLVGACRYEAVDDLTPRWLALYELDSPAVLDSAEYKAVVEGGSDRDKFIMSHLATLDRRIYSQLSDDGPGGDGPAPVILAVANSVPLETVDDMTAWYEQEHIPMLLDVPGWRRIRRFRLMGRLPWTDLASASCRCTSWPGLRCSPNPATGPRSARRGGTGPYRAH